MDDARCKAARKSENEQASKVFAATQVACHSYDGRISRLNTHDPISLLAFLQPLLCERSSSQSRDCGHRSSGRRPVLQCGQRRYIVERSTECAIFAYDNC